MGLSPLNIPFIKRLFWAYPHTAKEDKDVLAGACTGSRAKIVAAGEIS